MACWLKKDIIADGSYYLRNEYFQGKRCHLLNRLKVESESRAPLTHKVIPADVYDRDVGYLLPYECPVVAVDESECYAHRARAQQCNGTDDSEFPVHHVLCHVSTVGDA